MYQNCSSSAGTFQPEVLRTILIDARYLRDRGCWANARDRAEMAAQQWHREAQQTTIGAAFNADWLADDVHKLTGVARAICQREARRVCTRTQLEAIADEIRQCVVEDKAKLVSLPTRKSPYRGTAAASRRA